MMGLIDGLRGSRAERRRATASEGALRITGKLARQRALVVVISDFRGDRDWRRPLLEVAGRHEVICVEVRDPREQELPDAGELRLVDPETGRQLRVNTSSAVLRRRFAAAAEEERRSLAAMLAGGRSTARRVSTEGDWLRSLTGFLRARPMKP